MRFLAAALILRRLGVAGSDVAAVVSADPPGSSARSSAILASMRVFCASKPSMAAVMISGVSFCVGMSPAFVIYDFHDTRGFMRCRKPDGRSTVPSESSF